MPTNKPQGIRTIAGRWKHAVEVSKLEQSLTERELALACAMFYAGFSASLEAGMEIAEIPNELEAFRVMQHFHTEVAQVAGSIEMIVKGGKPS